MNRLIYCMFGIGLVFFSCCSEEKKDVRAGSDDCCSHRKNTDRLERIEHEIRDKERELRLLDGNSVKEIRYHADRILRSKESNTIILKGRVWYVSGSYLIDGRLDPKSELTLDAKTLRVLSVKGNVLHNELLK